MPNSFSPRQIVDPFLQTENWRGSKKIANNTRLVRRDDDTVALRLHSTDVVTYKRDGTLILDSGGWRTLTTRDRINMGLPSGVRLSQERRVWCVSKRNGSRWVFEDGMILRPDGRIEGAEQYDEKSLKASLKVQRRIAKYAKDFVSALKAGNVPAPSGGDCWGCFMRAEPDSVKDDDGLVTMLARQDGNSAGAPVGELGMFGDHIDGHLREKYYVPSLLARAIELFPVSIIARDTLAVLWGAEVDPRTREFMLTGWGADLSFDQIEKSLRRYVLRSKGLSA